MKVEQARLKLEIRAEFAGCSSYRRTHGPVGLIEQPHRWDMGEGLLVFAQCHGTSGNIHRGSAWADLWTGNVRATAQPPMESVRVRPLTYG